MTPDEWARKVEIANERWQRTEKEISLGQWQAAMMEHADRVGAWQRMTRWQRARARITGRVRRIIRALI